MVQCYGWTLFALPLFLGQLEKMIVASERERQADPRNWQGNASVKVLATLITMVLDRVPRDPLSPAFRQGSTLGPAHRHWFRVKFGANRFRLFFRADLASRVIVYAWVNDRDTLRKAGSASDPYAVFSAMLKRGNPPAEWPSLLAEARAAEERFAIAVAAPKRPD